LTRRADVRPRRRRLGIFSRNGRGSEVFFRGPLLWRELGRGVFLDFEPVLRNGVGQANRIKKIERFNEERIGAELVRLVDIADSVRSSQDDDGNILERGLATNPAQDFKAVGYRQSEIEQEKAGYRIKLTIGVASK